MAQEKIVLMACGSYSPPTYMHLRMFEIARDQIHSTGRGVVVGGIVSPVHDAYGKKELVAAHHRLGMLRLALRSSAWVKVSEWETRQPAWTRTRLSLQYHQDTINEHLRSAGGDPPAWLPDDILNNALDEPDNLMEKLNGNHGNDDYGCHDNDHDHDNGHVTVRLLCGADLLESFSTPGLWSDEDVEGIVRRHGLVVVSRAGSDPGRFVYDNDLLYRLRNNIHIVTNYVPNEVSSTALRRALRRRESVKYLTDDAVIAYIARHRLYAAATALSAAPDPEYILSLNNKNKRSPDDVTMTSPEETSYKNILISIRDKPSIVDETITVKRARKTNFLMPNSHTDSVAPILNSLTPKLAYVDQTNSQTFPGKAVKIVSDVTQHKIKTEQVSSDNHTSLDSYLSKNNSAEEIYKRRVSEGSVGKQAEYPVKKRCSSTIRKLNPEEIKKSKSEVSKLCDKVKSIKLKEPSKSYRTRSCNDIVRLVLTRHGIHVISDTEAIV